MKAPKRMQTAFLVLLLCGIVFQPGPAQSSTQKTQTLEQALNPARLKVPALLSARARIEEARALGGTASVGQPSVQVVETPLASKHAYGLAIAITSQSGKLTEGMNSICAVFLSSPTIGIMISQDTATAFIRCRSISAPFANFLVSR